MKLQRRIVLVLVIMLTLSITLVSIFYMTIFSNSFQSYLVEEQESRLKEIVSEINFIFQESKGDIDDRLLEIYSRYQSINIYISTIDGTSIASYESLHEHKDSQITKVQYSLVNDQKEKIAILELEFDHYNQDIIKALQIFRQSNFKIALLFFAIYFLIIPILSYYLSKQITNPIEKIEQAMTKIRLKKYDEVKLPNSSIHELEDLSSHVSYLSSILSEQERVRKEYAQDISHELRTPLTQIMIELEACEDGILPLDQELIKSISSSSKSLLQIVNSLEKSFASSSLLTDVVLSNIDLSLFVHEYLDSFEPHLSRKNARLIRSIEENQNLKTDPRLFKHILSNLLSNALKAIDEGGFIRVQVHPVEDQMILRITDNGIGIKKEDLPYIFERFYRVDPARSSQYQSKGLGLSIVKNICDKLGAKIHVASRLGKGTAFTLSFPIEGPRAFQFQQKILDD